MYPFRISAFSGPCWLRNHEQAGIEATRSIPSWHMCNDSLGQQSLQVAKKTFFYRSRDTLDCTKHKSKKQQKSSCLRIQSRRLQMPIDYPTHLRDWENLFTVRKISLQKRGGLVDPVLLTELGLGLLSRT